MNRRIVEIDADIARLRAELVQTQKQLEGLAEERGRVLAALQQDTEFIRKTRLNAAPQPNGAR